MFKLITKLLRALSSNTDPGAVAHAFACGILLGLLPKDNLLWYVLFVFIFFMRIQRAAFALTLVLGSILAALADPFLDSLGYWFLTLDQVKDAYIFLLDIPFIAFLKINNTIVIGSIITGIVVYIPCYWLARGFVFLWRKYIASGVRKLKVVQVLKQVPLISKLASMAAGK